MTGTIMGDSISSHPSIYRKNIFLFIHFLFIVASQSPSVSTANHTIVGTAPQHDYTCDLEHNTTHATRHPGVRPATQVISSSSGTSRDGEQNREGIVATCTGSFILKP
ncbi:unnamed protein product [Sphacelaria rigidula]